MSQPNENKTQPKKPHTEFSVDISGEQTHLEITIPSEQAKQIIRPLALLFSHLLAAGLATISMNPAQIEAPRAVPNTAAHPQDSLQ